MRQIFAETEVPRQRFWRRQFNSGPTRGQELFDGIFGVILPVLCLVADPTVFKGGIIGPPWLARYQVLAYLICAVEIAVFIVWRTFRTELTTFSAPFAGILFAGGLFSTVIGIAILPLSVFGLIVVLGILGFIPFLTAIVYFRSAARAMKDQVNNSTYDFRFMTAVLAGVLVIALSVWGSIYLQPMFARTERVHRPSDETWDGD